MITTLPRPADSSTPSIFRQPDHDQLPPGYIRNSTIRLIDVDPPRKPPDARPVAATLVPAERVAAARTGGPVVVAHDTMYRQGTVLTTTTTSPGGVITINRSYASSLGGVLTFLELVFALIIFIMTVQTRDGLIAFAYNLPLFFVSLTSFCFLVVLGLILSSAFLSITGTMLPTTFFFMALHFAGFLMYFIGAVGMLVRDYSEALLVAGAAISFVAAGCHGIHFLLTKRDRY